MIDKNFPGKGRVALLRTRPETVLDDYERRVMVLKSQVDQILREPLNALAEETEQKIVAIMESYEKGPSAPPR